jgi:hypothetical protein
VDPYERYGADQTVLRAIGAHLAPQIGRITVRLPRSLAESAAAAWDRNHEGEVGDETREQHELRDAAAWLAFIGLAVKERGVPDGDEVIVDLDVGNVAAALRAVR